MTLRNRSKSQLPSLIGFLAVIMKFLAVRNYAESSTESIKVSYQPAGPGMKPRTAFVDPAVLPDPRAWLEQRLGPLAKFELEAHVQPQGAAV